ncbi:MAG: element excision factor XisI family protein [Cyanobacteria bacterium P01_H01_bin.150]
MEKLEKYREYIQSMLADYAESRTSHNPDNQLEMQTIFDTVHDHYQLIYVGWDKGKRVYGPVMHLDIKNRALLNLGMNLFLSNLLAP